MYGRLCKGGCRGGYQPPVPGRARTPRKSRRQLRGHGRAVRGRGSGESGRLIAAPTKRSRCSERLKHSKCSKGFGRSKHSKYSRHSECSRHSEHSKCSECSRRSKSFERSRHSKSSERSRRSKSFDCSKHSKRSEHSKHSGHFSVMVKRARDILFLMCIRSWKSRHEYAPHSIQRTSFSQAGKSGKGFALNPAAST